jgi:TolB protein
MNRNKFILTVLIFALTAGCSMPAASNPTPDLFATLQASTPSFITSPQATQQFPTPVYDLSTVTPTTISASAQTLAPSPSSADQPSGHIAFTCQIFKDQGSEQICIMNADGSGFKRLTTENNVRHFYPSLSPDGQQVLYSQYLVDNNYEIYRMDIEDGSVDKLTNLYGVDNAPEISPNGQRLVFMHNSPTKNTYQIVLADQNGGNAGNIPGINGWDPTWSPDGKQILFASDKNGTIQLYTVRTDGSKLTRITNLPSIRGRSDWSSDGKYIVTYSGEAWHRELYIMNADGTNVHQLTPSGGNSQGPSFSPDGKWVAFTAYFDHYNEDNGCEIYIIRIDGTDLRRLTNNDYCDYQPRWGP